MSSPTQELTNDEVEEYLNFGLSQSWIHPDSHILHDSSHSGPPSESPGRGFGHLYISPSIYYNPPEDNLQDPTFYVQHPSAATTEEPASNMNHHQPTTPLHANIRSQLRTRRPRRTATTPARIASINSYEPGSSPEPLSRHTVPRAYRPATWYRESHGSPRPLSRPTTVAAYRPADPRPPRAFLALNGYWGIRNGYHLLDCFEDCNRKRSAEKGVSRRANMLAHLRHYHGQDIERGGGAVWPGEQELNLNVRGMGLGGYM